jgi:hypothetical protein
MSGFRKVSVAELKPGSVLAVPVYDQNFKKLLNSGMSVDARFINRLRQRGITEVHVESTVKKIVSSHKVVRNEPEKSDQEAAHQQRCGRCRSAINIRPPAPELNATIWRCNNCDSIYFGSDEVESQLLGLTRVAGDSTTPFAILAQVGNSDFTPTIPPENVQRLAKMLAWDDAKWADRRQHPRHAISLPVIVLPLATDFRVNGDAVTMTTANISLGGAALLHTRFVDAPYLAIDFTTAGVDKMQVVLQVLRCRASGPVYEIGGKFISRLS